MLRAVRSGHVHEWAAEIVADEPLARRLIASQFPEVTLETVELLGQGWDNTVYLVDGRWVFRFPRREIAVPAIERQLRVLPQLAPMLPLPVRDPVFAGWPNDGFPWPFTGRAAPARRRGRRRVAGGLATRRTPASAGLGSFLRTLHDPALLALDGVAEGHVDPWGRADMERRGSMLRARIGELEAAGLWRAPPVVAGLIEEAEALPPPKALAVVHGDLHIRHVLVEGGEASGVIDWDDLVAPTAIDLVLLWAILPSDARADFLDAYGPVDEAQLLRARILALFLCGTLAVYGRQEARPALERGALAGLERTLLGSSGPGRIGHVHVTVTRVNTADQPLSASAIVAEEMERLAARDRRLRGADDALRTRTRRRPLLLAEPEVAERHQAARMEFIRRMTSVVNVEIEDTQGYELTFASLGEALVEVRSPAG